MFKRLLIANRGEIPRCVSCARATSSASPRLWSTRPRTWTLPRSAWRTKPWRSDRPRPRTATSTSPPSSRRHAPPVRRQSTPGTASTSEDPDFAEICAAEGFVFIGPQPGVLQGLGNKATARAIMTQVGLPLLPGTLGAGARGAGREEIAARIGYPVIIKAATGGGGRGMTVVHEPATSPRRSAARGPPRSRSSAIQASTSSDSSAARGTSRSKCCATRTAAGRTSGRAGLLHPATSPEAY